MTVTRGFIDIHSHSDYTLLVGWAAWFWRFMVRETRALRPEERFTG